MESINDFEQPEADAGELFVYQRAPKPELDARLRVRHVPRQKAKAIERAHSGKRQRLFVKKGSNFVEIDNDQAEAESLDKACYALMDSENFEVRVRDAGAAAFYSDQLKREVKVGELVLLDGQWTQAIKERLFASSANLLRFVLDCAVSLERAAAEIETSKAGS